MIGTDAMLDLDAMLHAEPASKIATALAWREHFTSTTQAQRDEWARAFGLHAMAFLSTTQPN
jgi:hypothetical protein